jgi:hypothetical protein
MSYTSSYESTTSSTKEAGTTYLMSSGDQSSLLSTSVSTTAQTSTPDNSDGLATSLGGEAIAVGEDTLAVGSISGTLVDGASATTLDGSATMVAASESSGGETAFTDAYTFAEISDGAEFVLVINQETDISQQSASGNTSTSTSSTTIAAYDLQAISTGTKDPVLQAPEAMNGDDGATAEPMASSPADECDGTLDLDGNIAVIDFNGLAVGEDTFVSVDAFALAIEDELSLISGFVVLAVD